MDGRQFVVVTTLLLLTDAAVVEADNQTYHFNFGVNQPVYGQYFTHDESSNGSAVDGQYRVLLPDHRLMVVDYSVNKQDGGSGGFKPKISFQDVSDVKKFQNFKFDKLATEKNKHRGAPAVKPGGTASKSFTPVTTGSQDNKSFLFTNALIGTTRTSSHPKFNLPKPNTFNANNRKVTQSVISSRQYPISTAIGVSSAATRQTRAPRNKLISQHSQAINPHTRRPPLVANNQIHRPSSTNFVTNSYTFNTEPRQELVTNARLQQVTKPINRMTTPRSQLITSLRQTPSHILMPRVSTVQNTKKPFTPKPISAPRTNVPKHTKAPVSTRPDLPTTQKQTPFLTAGTSATAAFSNSVRNTKSSIAMFSFIPQGTEIPSSHSLYTAPPKERFASLSAAKQLQTVVQSVATLPITTRRGNISGFTKLIHGVPQALSIKIADSNTMQPFGKIKQTDHFERLQTPMTTSQSHFADIQSSSQPGSVKIKSKSVSQRPASWPGLSGSTTIMHISQRDHKSTPFEIAAEEVTNFLKNQQLTTQIIPEIDENVDFIESDITTKHKGTETTRTNELVQPDSEAELNNIAQKINSNKTSSKIKRIVTVKRLLSKSTPNDRNLDAQVKDPLHGTPFERIRSLVGRHEYVLPNPSVFQLASVNTLNGFMMNASDEDLLTNVLDDTTGSTINNNKFSPTSSSFRPSQPLPINEFPTSNPLKSNDILRSLHNSFQPSTATNFLPTIDDNLVPPPMTAMPPMLRTTNNFFSAGSIFEPSGAPERFVVSTGVKNPEIRTIGRLIFPTDQPMPSEGILFRTNFPLINTFDNEQIQRVDDPSNSAASFDTGFVTSDVDYIMLV